MFGFPMFLMDPAFQKRQKERLEEERRQRLAKGCDPWSLNMKWAPRMNLQAKTWVSWSLFDVKPTNHHNPNHEQAPEGKFEVSPSGQFVYCEKRLKRGQMLEMIHGSKTGDVLFDADIYIPGLHEKYANGEWRERPWMSITPMELMTQRPGLRFAKGHTIVAGLGLGWFLTQVRAKKSVKKVTLVEKSQELVDWLLTSGRIEKAAGFPEGTKLAPLDVIVGDAYDVIPKMTADVALIDIFRSYGGNDFLDDLTYKHRGGTLLPEERRCSGIGRIWNWGKAHTKGSDW